MTDAPDLRDRLIEAATLLFAERGFDGIGLREIAQKAKANVAMISYHFGGKEGLYDAVLRAAFHRCPNKLALLERPAFDAAAPQARELAIAGLRDHLHAAVADLMLGQDPTPLDRAAMTVIMRELAEGGERLEALDREFMRPHFEHMTACLNVLKPGLSDVELLQLSITIIGPMLACALLPGLMRLRFGGRPFPPDAQAMADFVLDHTLRALGVEGA